MPTAVEQELCGHNAERGTQFPMTGLSVQPPLPLTALLVYIEKSSISCGKDMGLRIELQLDLSDGFDELSLLGNIRLSNGAHSLEEESVYLDSWLDALWAASSAARNSSEKCTIDLPEHGSHSASAAIPRALFILSFRENQVIASSEDEFEQAVLDAMAAFTDAVSKLSGKDYKLPRSQRSY